MTDGDSEHLTGHSPAAATCGLGQAETRGLDLSWSPGDSSHPSLPPRMPLGRGLGSGLCYRCGPHAVSSLLPSTRPPLPRSVPPYPCGWSLRLRLYLHDCGGHRSEHAGAGVSQHPDFYPLVSGVDSWVHGGSVSACFQEAPCCFPQVCSHLQCHQQCLRIPVLLILTNLAVFPLDGHQWEARADTFSVSPHPPGHQVIYPILQILQVNHLIWAP